jgi:hypothetical protein
MPAYTTLERVKIELGLDLAASTDDVWINYSIQSASKLIETLTGRVFGIRTWSIKVEQPFGFRRLQLPHTPINSITSISYKGSALSSSEYLIEDPEAGFVIRTDGISWLPTSAASDTTSLRPSQQPIGQYDVVFSAGYATVPEDIADAVTQQVVQNYYKKGRDPSVKSVSVLGDSISYASNGENQYHPSFSAAVSRYTRVPVL